MKFYDIKNLWMSINFKKFLKSKEKIINIYIVDIILICYFINKQ